jgi:hypothetical protein
VAQLTCFVFRRIALKFYFPFRIPLLPGLLLRTLRSFFPLASSERAPQKLLGLFHSPSLPECPPPSLASCGVRGDAETAGGSGRGVRGARLCAKLAVRSREVRVRDGWVLGEGYGPWWREWSRRRTSALDRATGVSLSPTCGPAEQQSASTV